MKYHTIHIQAPDDMTEYQVKNIISIALDRGGYPMVAVVDSIPEDPKDKEVMGFCFTDFQTQLKDYYGFELTDEQIFEVMNYSERKADASLGFCWDTMEDYANICASSHVRDIELTCPKCGKTNTGWYGFPRGYVCPETECHGVHQEIKPWGNLDAQCRQIEPDWDLEQETVTLTAEQAGAPKVVSVPASVPDDQVADWLSDNYGWCVNSWVVSGETHGCAVTDEDIE